MGLLQEIERIIKCSFYFVGDGPTPVQLREAAQEIINLTKS